RGFKKAMGDALPASVRHEHTQDYSAFFDREPDHQSLAFVKCAMGTQGRDTERISHDEIKRSIMGNIVVNAIEIIAIGRVDRKRPKGRGFLCGQFERPVRKVKPTNSLLDQRIWVA